MADIFKVAKRDYLENVKRKSFLYVVFGLPLLMGIIFAVQASFGSQMTSLQFNTPVGFVDASGLGFQGNGNTTIGYATVGDAKAALLSEKVGSVMLVGPDYLANGTVTVMVREGDLTRTLNDKAMQAFLVGGLVKDLPPDVRARIQNPPAMRTIELDASGNVVQSNLMKSIIATGVGLLLLLTIFMSSSFLMQSVVEEKENRVIEILLSSISARDLMAGKIIGNGALSLTQIIAWLLISVAGIAYFGGPVMSLVGTINPLEIISPEMLAVYLLYFIGGFLLYSSLLACIGSISTSMRESSQISAIVVLPAAAPLWFITVFMVEPNGQIAQFLSLFPFSAPLSMIMRMGMTAVPAAEIAASLAMLFLTVVLAVWVSAKLFRATILMYGQRPGIAQMISILRQA
ncbi:MAG: ABC transporter permease [Candidatus ainarchaeum sp.]|nr:ABC transporter permease [Candidatus ainarchaeum sp.]